MPRKKPGRGWHGNAAAHQAAGKKGGSATAATYGHSFYSMIGRKGGSVSGGNFARDPKKAQIIGRQGGKKRSKAASKAN
jgi:general stress protein YciG